MGQGVKNRRERHLKDEISPAKYVRSEVEGTTQGEMFFRLKAANYACSGLSLPETCPKRRGKKGPAAL